MSERDLILSMLVIVVSIGLIYGSFFARPRFLGHHPVRGRKALLVRIVVWFCLLIIIGYFGVFLTRFQRELFGSETLCPTYA